MKTLRALATFLLVAVIIFSELGCGADPKEENSWKNREDGSSDKPVLFIAVSPEIDLEGPQ